MNYQPTTNVLIALYNTLERNSSVLYPIFRSNGPVNAAGDSLEYFIKDMFCSRASQYQSEEEKYLIYDDYLSWLGNSSNFPDFIIKNGPGVEPKKINNKNYGTLALNSSYPKDYIYPESQNLPSIINESVPWERKDVIYVAGNLDTTNNKLLTLWFVYGNTMIADRSVYEDLIFEIRGAIQETNATLVNSKELARAKGIDPLKNSNLRVRGMYELLHPQIVFQNYINLIDIPNSATRIFLVILKTDYDIIVNKPDFSTFYDSGQLISNLVNIPDPNNPSSTLEAIIFQGWTK